MSISRADPGFGGPGERSRLLDSRSGAHIIHFALQSESRQRYVERIQSLEEWVQRELMWIIEQVSSGCVCGIIFIADLHLNRS